MPALRILIDAPGAVTSAAGKFIPIPNPLLISFKSLLIPLEKQQTVTQHAHQDRLNNPRHFSHLFLTFSCLDHAISTLSKLGECVVFVLSFVSMRFLHMHIGCSNVQVKFGMTVSR